MAAREELASECENRVLRENELRLHYSKVFLVLEADVFHFVQDMALNETRRVEASLKEEKGDAELEIRTLKRYLF